MKASVEEKDSHIKHGTNYFTYLIVMQIKCNLNIKNGLKTYIRPICDMQMETEKNLGEGKMAIYLTESPSKKANLLHFKRKPKQYYILSKLDLLSFQWTQKFLRQYIKSSRNNCIVKADKENLPHL